jgi:hypothetical protein
MFKGKWLYKHVYVDFESILKYMRIYPIKCCLRNKQYFPTASRSFANAFIDSLYAQRALEEGRRIVNGLSALHAKHNSIYYSLFTKRITDFVQTRIQNF